MIGDWTTNRMRILPHGAKEEIVCDTDASVVSEHGDADPRIISTFLVFPNDPAANKPKAGIREG